METNTVCVLVAATREGPEFAIPEIPPTKVAPPAPLSGLRRYTLCAPKSAIANCEPSGVSDKPRHPAFGGGPPGGWMFPAFEPPMLATLVRTLPEGPEWEYELKLDGYRLEAIKQGDNVRLYSRRGNDFTKKFARNRDERFEDQRKFLYPGRGACIVRTEYHYDVGGGFSDACANGVYHSTS